MTGHAYCKLYLAKFILQSASWKVIGRSDLLLQNKFFDPSTLSMRKVDDGGKRERREINGGNSKH